MASLNIDASNAREFYLKNNIIFLTGGTGFVGVALLEKILRSIPQIQKVYLLLRVSGKSTIQKRFEEVVNNNVFETLRSVYPTEEVFRKEIISKIVPVQGDISLDNYGMSPGDMKMVQSDTSVFIHSAASVRFDDPLLIAFNMNTIGTKRGLDIARGMPHLASFVHFSTAYILPDGHPRQSPEEIQLFWLGDHENIFDMATKMNEQEANAYEKTEVLTLFPNTYAFSKALTECMIKSWYKDLNFPVVIVRPTGVSASMNEPSVGWTQGSGPLNILVKSCALGHIQEWGGYKDTLVDYIPVDHVVKIALSAAVAANRSSSVPVVFHAGVSHNNPISLDDVRKYLEGYWHSVASPRKRSSDDIRCEFYPRDVLSKRFERRFGKQIKAAEQAGDDKTVKSLKWQYTKSMLYYTTHTNTWIFEAYNTIQLDESTADELYCGLKHRTDWDVYMTIVCYGTHKYLLGESVVLPTKAQKITPAKTMFTPRL